MKILYKASLFCAALFALSACNLDLMPTSSITISKPADAFKTMTDVEGLQNGMNASFRGVQQGIYWYTSEVQSDFFNATLGFGNRNGAPHTMNDGFTAADYSIRDYWWGMYSVITKTNVFLDGIYPFIEETKLSAENLAATKVYIGNAYFYRAFCYAKLAATYCDDYEPATFESKMGVPLVTTFDPLARPSRASLAETYNLIQSDIDSAKKYLAPVAGVVRSEVPTIDVVNALDARVKLVLHDFSGAAAAAGQVIANSAYVLSTSVAALQTELRAQTGNESIMLMFCSQQEGAPSNSIFIGGYEDGNYAPDFVPTATVYDSYQASDIRKGAYFEVMTAVSAGNQYDNFPFFAKYIGNPALTTSSNHASLTKPRVFGIAEMYLIKAEAEARTASPEAKTTLNALQAARGAKLTDGSLASVQAEWAKETIGEGLRIECLKRWNLGFTNREPINSDMVMTTDGYSKITVPAGFYKLTWAIPSTEIVNNSSLEGQQNAGW